MAQCHLLDVFPAWPLTLDTSSKSFVMGSWDYGVPYSNMAWHSLIVCVPARLGILHHDPYTLHGHLPSVSSMCPTSSLHPRNGCCTSHHDRWRCLALHGLSASRLTHSVHSSIIALSPRSVHHSTTLTSRVDHSNPGHISPNNSHALMHLSRPMTPKETHLAWCTPNIALAPRRGGGARAWPSQRGPYGTPQHIQMGLSSRCIALVHHRGCITTIALTTGTGI